MKQFLLSLTIFMFFAACRNEQEPIEKTGAVQLLPSVAAYNSDATSDTSTAAAPLLTVAKADNRPTKIIYITRETKYVPEKATRPVIQDPVPTLPAPNSGGRNDGSTTAQQGQGGVNTGETTVPPIPQPEKKKGWSNAAKGAVIGAGTGAIGGAIISKKKGMGAVIGGVVGAAGGYIIGKNIDKKNAGK